MSDIQFLRVDGANNDALNYYDFSSLSDFTLAEILGYYDPGDMGGGSFYLDKSSSATAVTGLIIQSSNVAGSGRWFRNLESTVYNAAWFGIKADGTDQTSNINTALGITQVKELLFDFDGDVTITGTVTVPSGKKLIFRNGCKLKGSASGTRTFSGGLIECDYKKQCFGSNLTVQNLENPTISVCWFGAVADFNGSGTDNLSFFQKAIAAGITGNAYQVKIYVPACEVLTNTESGNYYYLSDTLILNTTVELSGDGMRQSVLFFPGNNLGIKTTAHGVVIKDLTVRGALGTVSTGYNSTTAHGIWLNSSSVVENVLVRNFDGNGIQVVGDVGVGTNANLCRVINCKSYTNGRAGLYVQGGDSNACVFSGIDSYGNGRWNIWDESFLGNLHQGHHAAAGATDHNYQKTFVTHGGTEYICINDSTNVGIEPGVTSGWESYWLPTTLSSPFALVWNNSTQYYSGGGYLFIGGSQTGLVSGCYAETDQYPVTNSSRTLFVGGLAAEYGLVGNSLGILQDKVNAANIGSSNQDGTKGFFLSDKLNGLYGFMSNIDRTMELSDIGWRFRWMGLNSSVTAYIADPSMAPGTIGRSSSTVSGTSFMTMQNGVWAARFGDDAIRLMGLATQAPTSGEWATGDVLLNSGNSSTVIGWKCTAAGTPGTWQTVGVTTDNDVEITDSSKGVILKSPDGTKYRVQVNNSGTLTTTVSGSGYAAKRSLTVDKTILNIISDISGYRYPLSITNASLKTVANGGRVTSSNGYDIKFFSDSGLTTPLKFVLESYDGTTGNWVGHVYLPTLYSASDTVFYIAYGNSSITTNQSDSSTYDANTKLHIGFPNGTTLTANDETSNGYNGILVGSPTAVAGQIDGAAAFNGTSQYITLPDDIDNSAASGTISAWIYPTSNDIRFIFTASKAGDNDRIFLLALTPGTSSPRLYVEAYYLASSINDAVQTPDNSITLNAWNHVAVVSDGSSYTLYINGVSQTLSAIVGSNTGRWINSVASSVTNYHIAYGNSSYSYYFNGRIDEVDLSNAVKNADWMKADYLTVTSGSILTVGSEF